MPQIVDQLRPGARVAVIRLRSLGDCVLTTPALALLQEQRPDLEIGVAVDPPFRAVFAGNPTVRALLDPEWRAVRRFGAELCLNLHGGTRSMLLTALSGARWRCGFAHHRYSGIYHVPVPRAQQVLGEERTVHTAEHLASAMFHLGVPRKPIPRARLYAEPVRRARPYAVIHAFASAPDKTWPAGRFLAVARQLRPELDPIFIGGPGDDLTPFEEFETSRTSLAATMSLLAGGSLFLGNDSGPAHMAAAFGVPLVVMFAASDPVVWAPWLTESEVLIARDGMGALSTDTVLEAIGRLRVRVQTP